jgi:cytoskeleton protein RodZ
MNKSIGNILKEARRGKGLKLPEISSKLCISKTYLRALEGNDKQNLPAQTFTIGFLRTYATHLGLNADELVNKAKEVSPEEVPALEVSVPEKAHDSTMPSLMVLLVISAAFAGTVSGYSYFSGNDEVHATKNQQQPHELISSLEFVATPSPQASAVDVKFETPQVIKDQPLVVAASQDQAPIIQQPLEEVLAEKVVATISVDPESFVEIRAVSDTWMMIANSQEDDLFDNIIHKGESYRAPVGKGLFLTTGNAGGLEFFMSGKQLSVPSGHGAILNALAIDQVVLDPSLANTEKQELLP